MQRRDFVKGIAIASATTIALGQQTTPPPPQATQQGATPVSPGSRATPPTQTAASRLADFKAAPIPSTVPDIAAVTIAHFFAEQQMAALRKLSDVLMPALNSYPGALQAGTPEFIDFLIGVSPADHQHLYQSGLDRLNADAKKQFGTSFAQLNAEQADKLIRPALVTWMIDHPPADPFQHFIAIAHRDIRTATMNSQAWSAAAVAAGERAPGVGLYWSPIDPIVG
jgi:hypothetical protein